MRRVDGGLCAPRGFVAGGAASGIKKDGSKDMAVVYSKSLCTVAACYTQNKVVAAPVQVTQKHVSNGEAQAILCNSGNANTCNPEGIQVANACCSLLANELEIQPEGVVVASTGVIGQALPLTPFERTLPVLAHQLSTDGSDAAARAIMTTDTVKKEIAAEFMLGDQVCRIGMIGKGSGMIHPNMATMLVFITTDVCIDSQLLQQALDQAIAISLNQISIDGDTSTNDMVAILANGQAGNEPIQKESAAFDLFSHTLSQLCMDMSKQLAADGEGATKLVECQVEGASSLEIARSVAKSVISSNLVKTAMFGEDANWGRVLCAIGYTDGAFDASNISLSIASKAGCVQVCKNSAHYDFDEQQAANILAEDEIQLLIDLNSGSYAGTAWGCDLSYDYVKINGDYRT